ncbi:DEAD/DEAH box helicase family protein [Moritella sp. 28]|uniref:PGAP1-like alpha/beta domain-containing protein n=1 Tax=Moritella sp. 28 TaxID=2746232 RepID=UPI001BA5D4AF|nr:DEAD/DEAH box helicase family protein [Moritella sp. 28]QUM84610.1 PhoH family protein [Moritella sp. 28]
MLGVVFIHGLGGDEEDTWGNFPRLLMNDSRFIDTISIKFFSFPTSLVRFPIFSRKSPSIEDISESLKTWINIECQSLSSIILVTHSLGGLIARKYLVERIKNKQEGPKIEKLVMYASPNNGASLATISKLISFRHRHVKQLCKKSDFLKTLNESWELLDIPAHVPVVYYGGVEDKVVNSDSAKHSSEDKSWNMLPLKGHVNIVKPNDENDISYKALIEELLPIIFIELNNNDMSSDKFSPDLIQQALSIGKIINKLTEDQFNVIQSLRGNNQAIIHGCAGSGKTLIAAEKALRLDKAGLKTLLVCNSPLLSEYFKILLKESNIDIYYFNEWVYKSRENYHKLIENEKNWSHYLEPTEEEIIEALEGVKKIYDAIIVDEGQDFNDDWWDLIQSAFKDNSANIFYILSDDNQSLMPRVSNYPINEKPLLLTKNCRNSGNIYDVVRKFYPNAPNASAFLKDKGIYIENRKSSSELLPQLSNSVSSCIDKLGKDNLIILTTETSELCNSKLANFTIKEVPPWEWYEAVSTYLNKILRLTKNYVSQCVVEEKTGKKQKNKACEIEISKSFKEEQLEAHLLTLKSLKVPNFSREPHPNNEDIKNVAEFMRTVTYPFNISSSNIDQLKWRSNGNKLYLVNSSNYLVEKRSTSHTIINENRKSFYQEITKKINLDNFLDFFKFGSWEKLLPSLNEAIIKPYYDVSNKEIEIPLYDIASFKGLESDAVIVFVPSSRDRLDTNLYVAISRARFYLDIVIEAKSHAKSDKL